MDNCENGMIEKVIIYKKTKNKKRLETDKENYREKLVVAKADAKLITNSYRVYSNLQNTVGFYDCVYADSAENTNVLSFGSSNVVHKI